MVNAHSAILARTGPAVTSAAAEDPRRHSRRNGDRVVRQHKSRWAFGYIDLHFILSIKLD
jgi:hypothetical protein